MVDGRCSFGAFLKFMQELYGMQIVQFTLSASSSSQLELRFSLILESLPKVKLPLPEFDHLK